METGAALSLMEPVKLSEESRGRADLIDLALELARRSEALKGSLRPQIAAALARLVRAMNCYYSNLIEGHDTHPIAIERALRHDYSLEPDKRDLQIEARAHMAVQAWIDAGGLAGPATRSDALREVHRRFYAELPDSLCWVKDTDNERRLRVSPGAWREGEVQVGRHVAIAAADVPRFMSRFESAFERLGKSEEILAIAAAHHRLLWIHPFLDGNGRVARLMSHAMTLSSLDTAGLWSVARGLARRVADYKAHLAACDLPRRNDLDGRGTLSEEALVAFTRFFLETCIDQVKFMRSRMEPERLETRVQIWAEEEMRRGALAPRSDILLQALLSRGELARGDVASRLGIGERQARRVVGSLIEVGAVVSESSRAPLRLAFPATLASRWLPNLFPEPPP